MTNLYRYIESITNGLSRNEKRIRQYLLDNYDKQFSTKEIGSALYLAPSGVSRYLKKIKYKNIYHLNKDKANNDHDFASLFTEHLHYKKHLLDQTYALNTTENIVNFANQLSVAKIIYIYGLGYSALEASNLQMRLSRIGYRVILLVSRHDIIIQSSALMVEDSICLFITQTGETKELIDIAKLLKKCRINILTITNNCDSTVAQISNHILLVPKIYSGYKLEAIFSEVTVSLIIDLLYLVIIQNNYASSCNNYEKTKELII